MCTSLMESVLFFLIKEAHFYPCSLQVTSRCASRGMRPWNLMIYTLNRKILTFNLSVPTTMHVSFLDVEKKVQAFRDACPLPE